VPPAPTPVEFPDVTGDHGRIEAKGIPTEKRVDRDLLAGGIQQLLERMPRLLLGAVGPEAGGELLPADSAGPRCGEHRQDGEPTPLHVRGVGRSVPKHKAAECLETEHYRLRGTGNPTKHMGSARREGSVRRVG
jgi:hypothetical protein